MLVSPLRRSAPVILSDLEYCGLGVHVPRVPPSGGRCCGLSQISFPALGSASYLYSSLNHPHHPFFLHEAKMSKVEDLMRSQALTALENNPDLQCEGFEASRVSYFVGTIASIDVSHLRYLPSPVKLSRILPQNLRSIKKGFCVG